LPEGGAGDDQAQSGQDETAIEVRHLHEPIVPDCAPEASQTR
jgi:hypothetical protein